MFIWYINLTRRQDRHRSLQKNLRQQGVPQFAIRRFFATDRDAYDTPDALIDHAVEIGYPEFEKCRHHTGIHQFLGYMISYFRALREIAEQSDTVLLMEDDYHLAETYSEIIEAFEELLPPVRIAMLGYNAGSEDYKENLPIFNQTWQHGAPANGNSANIYTPEGADFLLQLCRSKMDTTPECVIQQIPTEIPGVYARRRNQIAIITSPNAGPSNVMDGRWTE